MVFEVGSSRESLFSVEVCDRAKSDISEKFSSMRIFNKNLTFIIEIQVFEIPWNHFLENFHKISKVLGESNKEKFFIKILNRDFERVMSKGRHGTGTVSRKIFSPRVESRISLVTGTVPQS